MSNEDKICVLCSKSCAGMPRIKNERGQYAHKACVDAKSNAQPAPVEEDNLYDDDLGGMDDLLDDIGVEEEAFGESAMACPGCGQRMADGTVVCMGCGYNTQSGKAMSTKSKSSGGSKIGGAAMGGAAAAGGLAAGPTLAFIGALIGGVIGAVAWGAIAYFTGFEIGWIAIGIGVLVGIGAQAGGGSQTTGGGMIVGVMAAIVAAASIAGGKYGASYMFVRDTFGSSMSESITLDEVNDDWVFGRLVDEVCTEQIENGQTIEWENQHLFVEAAMWPDDYPTSIQEMITEKWEGMDDLEQIALRTGFAKDYGPDYTYHDIDEETALSMMADMVATNMIEADEAIAWPNPNLAMDVAIWPEDYPESVQTLTVDRWAAMSADDQFDYRTKLMDSSNEMRAQIAEMFTQGSFIDSFKHPLDILFLLLAMGAAYKIGYGD